MLCDRKHRLHEEDFLIAVSSIAFLSWSTHTPHSWRREFRTVGSCLSPGSTFLPLHCRMERTIMKKVIDPPDLIIELFTSCVTSRFALIFQIPSIFIFPLLTTPSSLYLESRAIDRLMQRFVLAPPFLL